MHLRRLFKYLNHVTTPGCVECRGFSLIYWPEMFARPRSVQTLREKVGLHVPPSNLGQRQVAIRTEVERVLGSLRLPATAFASRSLMADHSYAHSQSPPAPDQYTIYRRVRPSDASLARVLATPPSLDHLALNSAGLPPEILALGYAWHALANRGQFPLDPAEVGVEFTCDGRLLINWRLFSRSTIWPACISNPDAFGAMLDLEGRRGLRSALEDRTALSYQRLCEETRIHLSEDGRDGPCSIVDQLWLLARPRWFDAGWHFSRSSRRHPTSSETGQKRTARIYRFLLPLDVQDRLPNWAKPNETIHAIARRQELLFAAPRQLHREMPPDGEHELVAWEKALDEFLLAETFGSDGSAGYPVERPRSTHFQVEHRKRMEGAARELFQDFVDLESLSKSRLGQVRRHLARRYAEAEPHRVESRWYHDWAIEKARERIPVAAVRRRAEVIDAERWPEPTLVSFFSQQALQVFEKTARSMNAPYLRAWAAFCLELAERDPRLRDSEDGLRGQGWTPGEDFALLTRYHSSPRMSPDEWRVLLEVLAPRNRRACQTRIAELNAVIKKLVSAAGRGVWRVGRQKLSDAKAKRTIRLIGIWRRSKRHELTVNYRTPAIRRARTMADGKALAWELPDQYASSDFDRWLTE